MSGAANPNGPSGVRGGEALDRELRRFAYPEIEATLTGRPTPVLLALLESSSRKVGDSAADILAHREAYSEVLSSFLGGDLKQWRGRVRALKLLHRMGVRLPDAWRAYEAAVSDRSTEVLCYALFGLVQSRRTSTLPLIEREQAAARPGSHRYNLLVRARIALETGKPHEYSPGFHDACGVWGEQ